MQLKSAASRFGLICMAGFAVIAYLVFIYASLSETGVVPIVKSLTPEWWLDLFCFVITAPFMIYAFIKAWRKFSNDTK